MLVLVCRLVMHTFIWNVTANDGSETNKSTRQYHIIQVQNKHLVQVKKHDWNSWTTHLTQTEDWAQACRENDVLKIQNIQTNWREPRVITDETSYAKLKILASPFSPWRGPKVTHLKPSRPWIGLHEYHQQNALYNQIQRSPHSLKCSSSNHHLAQSQQSSSRF